MSAAFPSSPTRPAGPWRRALGVETRLAVATPSAVVLFGAAIVMAVVSAIANLAVLDDLTGEIPVRIALHSATVPALVFSMVVGALSGSADRRTGFVEQRLLTDPSRRRWFLSKVAVQAGVGLAYGTAGVVVAVVVTSGVFSVRDATFDPTSAVVVRSLAGVLVASALFAVVGTAVGSQTGNSAAVVAGLLSWILVIEPPAVLGLPALGRYLPAAGGLALTNSPDEELLGQLAGGAALVAYSLAAVALAARRIGRQDL